MATRKLEPAPPAGGREIVEMPVAHLIANPRNPRKHSDDQIQRLMASLRRDGQTLPVLARKANRMLIAGHGITRAMAQLGWETASVMLLDVDQAAADRIMLGDNRLSDLSTTDQERVTELMREIDAADWLAAGFSEVEAAKLLETVAETDLEVFEIPTSEVRDQFWIAVRGPLAEQAMTLQKIRALMRDLPQVSVELGTIEDV